MRGINNKLNSPRRRTRALDKPEGRPIRIPSFSPLHIADCGEHVINETAQNALKHFFVGLLDLKYGQASPEDLSRAIILWSLPRRHGLD